ncbi:MAG: hypothetical protein A2Y62_11635, partial [Candidatus Fischerbacteria bacterium RBG_13_37_8]
DTANPYFKSKYADLCEVVNTIKKAMVDAKAVLLIEQYPITEYKDAEPQCTTPKVGVCTRLTDVDSGEWESTTVYAYPAQDTPQAIGSVITYLRRYTLMPIFGVVPEDDDGNAASGSDKMDQRPPADRRPPATGRPAQQPPAPAQQPASASQPGPRPTRGNPRRATAPQQPPKTATPVMSALPAGVTPAPAEQGPNDLPWEPEAPAATQPASTFTQKEGCIGQSEYDQIIMGLHAKKIKKLKWLAYIKEKYNVDTASALTMEQFKEVFALIYSNPAAIDPGQSF